MLPSFYCFVGFEGQPCYCYFMQKNNAGNNIFSAHLICDGEVKKNCVILNQ